MRHAPSATRLALCAMRARPCGMRHSARAMRLRHSPSVMRHSAFGHAMPKSLESAARGAYVDCDGHCTVAVAIRFAPKPDFSNAILHTFRNTLRVRPALGNTTGLDNHPGMFFLAALGCIPRLAGKLLSASAPSQAICPSTLSACFEYVMLWKVVERGPSSSSASEPGVK